MIESATFWLDGPEVSEGELRPEAIGTEVFFLPAAEAPAVAPQGRRPAG